MTDVRDTGDTNPLLEPWEGPFAAPPFDRIRPEHFRPALEAAMAGHRAEIEAIATDPAAPDFANTIEALERAGEALARVRRLFWALSSAHGTEGIRAIEQWVSAVSSRHASEIGHDPRLFARVASVWENRGALDLTAEQTRLVENSYDRMVRGGALLDGAAKLRFAAIDARLAELSVQFGQNILAATQAFTMLADADDLEGLPAAAIDAAARRAERIGQAGRYALGLDRGEVETFLTFATRRDLRETLWRGFTSRCDGGAFDNNPLIAEIAALRLESAGMLGFGSYADFKLADSMARTPDAAAALMERVWAPAKAHAQVERDELQALMDAERPGAILAPWDWLFYAERIRRERYALDGAAVAAYLDLDAVRAAAFDVAGRLYGLRFGARQDVAVYQADVRAWEVTDADGGAVGLLYTDYHARPEKHGGAWMGSLRVQEKMDGAVAPIVYTVANFARPQPGARALLAIDEARTLFHEFGHALHALLSDVTYPSLAGTAVCRDFVEFPSKIMEHWIVAPEILRGLGMPDALIAGIARADVAGQGHATVEFLASAMLDLALHRRTGFAGFDARVFEAEELARIGIPEGIGMRHRLPCFSHIFDGGYASAYYSYLWAEVLDGDAFEAFIETGDLFDAALADRFRRQVLAFGDSRDPMESFIAFRGRAPDESGLLRQRGLTALPELELA
ncbi:MAG: family peptidase [Sphingomonas bacterium]|nr:M3 family metallopeptidase [Sphingomonas bacterium]MDB5688217.1 family peptidase [Sphingomonas bacterium]